MLRALANATSDEVRSFPWRALQTTVNLLAKSPGLLLQPDGATLARNLAGITPPDDASALCFACCIAACLSSDVNPVADVWAALSDMATAVVRACHDPAPVCVELATARRTLGDVCGQHGESAASVLLGQPQSELDEKLVTGCAVALRDRALPLGVVTQVFRGSTTGDASEAISRALAADRSWLPAFLNGDSGTAVTLDDLIHRLLGNAATDQLPVLDAICCGFVEPYAAYCLGSPSQKLKAVPYVSLLAHHKVAVIPKLWRVLDRHSAEWACKDRNGALQLRYPNIILLFAHATITYLGSAELDDLVRLLSHDDLGRMVRILRDTLYRAIWYGHGTDDGTVRFIGAAMLLLRALFTANQASRVVPNAEWVAPGFVLPPKFYLTVDQFADASVSAKAFVATASGLINNDLDSDDDAPPAPRAAMHSAPPEHRVVVLLRAAPFLLPFGDRVRVFGGLLMEHRDFGFGFARGDRPVFVSRSAIFEDAYDKMGKFSAAQLMARSDVRFQDDGGRQEMGYGQGVFREFLTAVLRGAFSPDAGLFEERNERVMPNANADAVLGEDCTQRFKFAGRLLGKAMREGVLVDVPVAAFVRNVLLGQRNSLSDLQSYDGEVYQRLVSLRSFSAEELESCGLTFTYSEDVMGVVREVELMPGGANTPVSAKNVVMYIHLYADYLLNRRCAKQMRALREGLYEMVQSEWLQFFDVSELQTLIQGQEANAPLDVDDWAAHTRYSGDFSPHHPTIQLLWEALRSMTPDQQRSVLQFATAASRAPLLGFQHLNPPFTVVSSNEDVEHLPTAATCMCTIRLPLYTSMPTLKEKLLLAAGECKTFEMS